MLSNEISLFNESRVQIRAYLVYLMQKNIPCTLPSITLETVLAGVKSLRREIDFVEAFYILDAQGNQVSDTISSKSELRKKDKGTKKESKGPTFISLDFHTASDNSTKQKGKKKDGSGYLMLFVDEMGNVWY